MKIVIVVPNACNPDFRVVKQAETLARFGHEVIVYCGALRLGEAKAFECVNSVTYIRREWRVADSLKNWGLHMSRAISVQFSDNTTYSNSISAKIGVRIFFKYFILTALVLVFNVLKYSVQLIKILKSKVIRTYKLLKSKVIRTYKLLKSKVTLVIKKLNRLFFVNFKDYSFYHSFFDEIHAMAPEIIYCHDGATTRLGSKIAASTGATFLYDSHELETHRSPPLSFINKFLVKMGEKKYLPQAFQVFTVGEKIAEFLEAEYEIKKPIVLYNAPTVNKSVWPEHWAAQNERTLRDDVSLNNDENIFVYTGNVAFGRGCEDVISALAMLREEYRYSDAVLPHFVMVGKAEESVKAALTSLASKGGVEEKIHFVEPVAAHSVVDYISNADFSIIPVQPKALSYQYAMPNKLFEATVAGLPILGSDLAEMGPFIKNNNLGITYVPENISDLASKMDELLATKHIYDRSHRREIALKYSWENQESKLIDVISSIETERAQNLQ